MKLYVTGIAGMLGYGIYTALKDKAVITGTDIVDIDIPGLSYQKISLYDMEAVERDIVNEKPDVVVHTAAAVNVDECEEKPEYARRLNTEVTGKLAAVCERHGIQMVYISTDAVFDGETSALYTEEDAVNPINVYGKTKLDGEAEVLKNPRGLVFRTNIYGINIQKKQSFGEWIYNALKEDKTLHMFTDIYFSPILVNDLADLIYRACEKQLSGLYHACGTGCISKYDFGKKLKEVFKIETGSICKSVSGSMKFKAKRAKHMGMSNRKLRQALGVYIRTPEESIEKFYSLLGDGRRGN